MTGGGRRLIYPVGGAVLLALSILLGGGGVPVAHGQETEGAESDSATVQWRLIFDGERTDWPGGPPHAPLDSLKTIGKRALAHVQRAGYYYATLDSATVDSSSRPPIVRLYGHRGPLVRIGELRIEGVDALPEEEIRSLLSTAEGDPLRPKRLKNDVETLLDRYREVGRPLAKVHVSETRLTPDKTPILRVTLRVQEGPKLWLRRIVVPNDARTSPEFLGHLAGLEIGAPLRDFDPESIRRRIQREELFEAVKTPTLEIDSTGGAVLRIPVEEAAPGSFNFVLGYLPASQRRSSGQLVGQGHLLLKNVFGGGRTADFTLDRRPGRTSIVNVSLADPYLFGLPMRIAGQFRGEQRDSTYGERTLSLKMGYRLKSGFEVSASLSREVVRPGPAGTRLVDRRQQIPRSVTFFYGLGIRYEEVSPSPNPRRGLLIDLQLSQGRKTRRGRRITPDEDTTSFSNSVRQERLRARVRTFVPLSRRHVFAIGGKGALLLTPGASPDRSDLFRLGGAESLRGYDEDRFLGNIVARGLLEYRFRFDPRSYAFGFVDLGYVARPTLDTLPSRQGWHPGYGVGVRFQTEIGRISTTYALNPEVKSFSNGRIHLGLSVGL